jgi:hypothetical protein
VKKRGRTDKRGPAESLMDAYVRARMAADPAVDQGDVERSCTSKQPYKSEGEARAIAAMNGMKLHTYHCRYCDFWHLTRRPTSGGETLIDD